MAHGSLDFSDTKKLYNKLVEKTGGAATQEIHDLEELESQLYIINKAIGIADLMIRIVKSPWDEMRYIGISNETVDDQIRHATHLKTAEIEFFFKLLDEFTEEPNGSLLLSDAQNYTTKNMSVNDCSHAIQNLHALHWLKIIKKAGEPTIVVPGSRSLIELRKVRQWATKFLATNRSSSQQVRANDVMDVDTGAVERSQSQRRSRLPSQMSQEDAEEQDVDEDEIRPVRRKRSARRLSQRR